MSCKKLTCATGGAVIGAVAIVGGIILLLLVQHINKELINMKKIANILFIILGILNTIFMIYGILKKLYYFIPCGAFICFFLFVNYKKQIKSN